jgi:DNA-binding transcriptional MocR family regulator
LERGYLRAHRRRITQEYRARRDALHGALTKHLPRGVRWQLPSHGIVLWLSLPPELDPQLVYEEALRRGVLVSPSSLSSPDASCEPALRLTFCAEPSERLIEGARRLGLTLRQLLARRSAEAEHVDRPVQEVV